MLLLFGLINSLGDSDESREEYSRAKFIQACTASQCVELQESQASPRTGPHQPTAAALVRLGAEAQQFGFNQAFGVSDGWKFSNSSPGRNRGFCPGRCS